MRPIWLVIPAMALLSACVSYQQEQARNALQELLAGFRSETSSNPRLDPIRDKVALVDAREVTLPMLSLTTMPTGEEKRALGEWQGLARSLQLRINGQLQRSAPWAIPILEASRAASLTLLARLYGGTINYGQYNQQRLELVTRTAQTIQAREHELRYEQTQIAAQQSIATGAALATYQDYLLQEQLINQQMQPVRAVPFSCTRFGNTTTCY